MAKTVRIWMHCLFPQAVFAADSEVNKVRYCVLLMFCVERSLWGFWVVDESASQVRTGLLSDLGDLELAGFG